MVKIKECRNCGAYKAYYTKGFCQFDKQNLGHCGKHNCIIEDKHHTCELWRNDCSIQISRRVSALKKIDEVADSLLQIKQILIEEKVKKEKTNSND